ncbi:MAG: hypothetical protein IKU37_01270 [Candidatus Gastranaerophilales bacterium]|nr:hypothetical protein [Candidatus Gastranaerophilales bacterium]
MAIDFKVNTKVDGLDKFKKYIEYVSNIAKLSNDKKFQEFLQKKFLNTVNFISQIYLPDNAMKSEYIKNNQIRPMDNGFIIYNNTAIDTDSAGYGGKFSIALAFEYGTGIIGQNNPKVGAWQYNVKGHTDGWWYPSNEKDTNPIKFVTKDGLTLAWTKGFEGYEIYRYSKEEIEKNLPYWVKEYTGNNGGVGR